MPSGGVVAVTTYTAICERIGKWWEITVPEIDEVTQAKRLDDVEETVRDLVTLMADVAPENVAVEVKARGCPPPARKGFLRRHTAH
jgi:hypothetical protein